MKSKEAPYFINPVCTLVLQKIVVKLIIIIIMIIIIIVLISNKVKQSFPHRESNPGHGGESAGS